MWFWPASSWRWPTSIETIRAGAWAWLSRGPSSTRAGHRRSSARPWTGYRPTVASRAKRQRARRCSTFLSVGGMGYGLAFEGLIDKLVGLFVHLAGDPGKLPSLEGL